MASDEVPPFALGKSQFDQSTYWGRFKHFFQVVNPLTLLTTSKQLTDAQNLLNQYKNGVLPQNVSDKQLWDAQRICSSIIHPDTGEIIPFYLRMSFFVPINIPIAAGMVVFGKTTGSQLFWQWMNQSYNAGMNYANRNATLPVKKEELALSYVAATGIACGVAFGLGRWSKKIIATRQLTPVMKSLVERGVPFLAVAAAGVGNVVLMRWNNVKDGITVQDKFGNTRGTSLQAGRDALTQVALTRVVLPIPIILFPPYVIEFVKNISIVSRLLASKPYMALPVELTAIACCLIGALPASVALFPQVTEVDASRLEPKFQNMTYNDGTPVNTFYYNKGL